MQYNGTSNAGREEITIWKAQSFNAQNLTAQYKAAQCDLQCAYRGNHLSMQQCNSRTLLDVIVQQLLNAIVQQLLNAVQSKTTQRAQEVTLLSTCSEESIAMQ